MLCPKCGYISFDNLSSCSKCHQDLSELQISLNGTAIQVVNNYFLSSASPNEDDTDFTEAADAVIDTLPDDVPEQEPPEMEQETDELAMDLDDMPPIDLSEIASEAGALDLDDAEVTEVLEVDDSGPGQAEEKELEGSIDEETQPVLDLETEQAPSDDIEVPNDTESLTLEINDDAPALGQTAQEASGEEGNNEIEADQIPINLNQIDLSDLIHSPEKTQKSGHKEEQPEAEQQASENEAISELSLETDSNSDNSTIGLALHDPTLESETPEAAPENLELVLDIDEAGSGEENLEPVDLTLELETETEEVNMSLDDILEESDKD